MESSLPLKTWRWIAFLDRFNPRKLRSQVSAASLARLHPEIHLPTIVHLDKITPLQNPKWFQGEPFFQVDFRIDTLTPGHHTGEISAALGRRHAYLPIEFTVNEGTDLPRILITSPFYGNATANGTNFSAVVEFISSLPCRVDYLRSLPATFDGYRVVLLAEAPLTNLTEVHIEVLNRFIEEGGRVVVACGRFVPDSVAGANRLATNFALSVSDKGIVDLVSTNIVPDVLTSNVNIVRSLSASIELKGPNVKPLILSNDGSNCVAAVARLRSKGELVAITTALWWSSLDRVAASIDNRVLLGNLLVPSKD